MRECEHTCSGHSKIQARAMDPSKYLAEILTDGTGGQAMNVARRPLPEGEHQNIVRGLPVTRPAVHSRTLRSRYRRSRLRPRPPPERVNVCTYIPNLSEQEVYVQDTKVLHVHETRAMQRYLSIQQCTSSNGEKGDENREGLSPAYVSAIGLHLQTPARTSLYQAVWRYRKFYSIYSNSAGCKPFSVQFGLLANIQ
jgi:hypothetical protein